MHFGSNQQVQKYLTEEIGRKVVFFRTPSFINVVTTDNMGNLLHCKLAFYYRMYLSSLDECHFKPLIEQLEQDILFDKQCCLECNASSKSLKKSTFVMDGSHSKVHGMECVSCGSKYDWIVQ